MSIKENETQVPIEYEFNKLNILDNDANANHKFCSYCSEPFTEEFWCKKCDPFKIIEGWSSGNPDIDKFIKDTMYDIRGAKYTYPLFLEWVPFDSFEDIKQIGEGGFAKVYSAKWIDGKAEYKKQVDGSWKKLDSELMEVALKRLNGSQNISAEFLNKLKIHWNLYLSHETSLDFYGITKDPETKEFMMIIGLADMGSLKSVLSSNFSNILWKDKIKLLMYLSADLNNLHELGYFHKDLHSGNILHSKSIVFAHISDFGLSGPANEQKSNDKICGVLPYIAPEVLNGKPYTLSSDIYSFGVVMAELSSGKPPFHKRKHDFSLALTICNGLRPEFGKGTPEIYKKLAYKCMNANPDQRPTANELSEILRFWEHSISSAIVYQEVENFGYKGKEVKSSFEEADKEIPNISTSYEKVPDAIYTSRIFTFSNLPKPINSSIITSYINDNENNKDSQQVGLGIPSSLQFKDVDDENSYD